MMKRRALLQSAALASTALHSFMAHAARAPRKYAVLVGVSALTQQPRHLWLDGPSNDVQAMRKALQAHGFAGEDILVLADDAQKSAKPIEGARWPDRGNILNALQHLRKRLSSGDAVVLYWSGHGVRSYGPGKSVQEADGKSTFLLASDAARTAAGSSWPLQGAIADAELGAFIDDCLAAKAHVMAVLDVCHAASATRAAGDDVKWRGLKATELQELQPSQSNLTKLKSGALPKVLPDARPRASGFVGFYACEDMQRTPEWKLNGASQGVFTYSLVQALQALKQGASYGNLAQQVLDSHGLLAKSAPVAYSLWPSPVFEGTLQAALWQHATLPVWTDVKRPNHQRKQDLPAGVQVLLKAQAPGQKVLHVDIGKGSASSRNLGRMPVGTQFELQVINQSAVAIYLRIFHADGQGRWTAIYPQRSGDAASLSSGSQTSPAQWSRTLVIDQAEAVPEALFWTIAPLRSQQFIDDELSHRLPSDAWQAQLNWQAIPAI